MLDKTSLDQPPRKELDNTFDEKVEILIIHGKTNKQQCIYLMYLGIEHTQLGNIDSKGHYNTLS